MQVRHVRYAALLLFAFLVACSEAEAGGPAGSNDVPDGATQSDSGSSDHAAKGSDGGALDGPGTKPSDGASPDGTLPDGTSPDTGTATGAISTYAQGLFHGEDPRVRLVNGFYYTIFWEGDHRKLFKSRSLIDRGVGKEVPSGYPHFAPVYIDKLNGQTYGAWFAFDTSLWECDCADPYDNIDQWHNVKSIPFTAWSIDFELFQNPQPGTYQGHWYLAWAGADTPNTGWAPESVFIAEILDLRAGHATLAHYDNGNANRVATYAGWSDVVAEAPGPAIHGSSVSIVYSGNGAQTDEYALGVAILKSGADPSLGASFIDHNQGKCDGDVKTSPEFARTTSVFGPGVARFTTSADGTEDWMMFHAKSFDTYNRGSGTPGQQDNNEEWARYVNIEKIGWRDVTCSGKTYSIPSMGTPADQGTALAVPSGDPGIIPGKRRIEAEAMIPFGFAMGNAIQSISRINSNPEVLLAASSGASNGSKVTHLDALANDVTTTPKRAGIVFRNAPSGSSLTVATASTAAAQLDLYLNGVFAQTLMFPATGGADTFHETTVPAAIPLGAEIRLVYEQGKSAAADIDYIEITP